VNVTIHIDNIYKFIVQCICTYPVVLLLAMAFFSVVGFDDRDKYWYLWGPLFVLLAAGLFYLIWFVW